MRIDLAFYLRVVAILGRDGYFFEQADPRWANELLPPDRIDADGPFVTRSWNARYRAIANCATLLDKASARRICQDDHGLSVVVELE
jgi:hypothetical protein